MRMLTELSRDDMSTYQNPYSGEKSAILQESRIFNAAALNSKKCCQVLTKILYMLNNGEILNEHESSELFFGITRLFQSNDDQLRRMVYLSIKNLDINESEAFVIISSLIKDINSNNDCYRANSLRVISKIADGGMIAQIERYLKSSIIDKNSFVSSSALICGYNILLRGYHDIPKRWLNEITECIQNRSNMVQYHAIILLLQLRKNDKLATIKIIEILSKLNNKSAYSECILLKEMLNIIINDQNTETYTWMIKYISNMLVSRNETILIQAIKSMYWVVKKYDNSSHININDFVDTNQFINVIQNLLNSSNNITKFAIIRVLNDFANIRLKLVVKCQHDLELLLSENNKTMTTLILTILLKISHENNLERLIKQISNYIVDMNDINKKDIINATKNLIIKYPNKNKCILNFLSTNLRDEGSLEYKLYVLNTIFDISLQLDNILENILYNISEIIEDCEYTLITIKILGFLGNNLHKSSQPSKYIRYIYNRLILENSAVRAACIDSLYKIATNYPKLKADIKRVLKVCSNDIDDEVRDRSNLYNALMDDNDYLQNNDVFSNLSTDIINEIEYLSNVLDNDYNLVIDFNQINNNSFNPIPCNQNDHVKNTNLSRNASIVNIEEQSNDKESIAVISERLKDIISQETLGEFRFSSCYIQLTENEAEYFVKVRKHLFSNHEYLVLDFNVLNTLNKQTLNNIYIDINLKNLNNNDLGQFEILGHTQISTLNYNQSDSTYIVLKNLLKDQLINLDNYIKCTLVYVVKEDDDPIGYQDEFLLESFHVSFVDYLVPNPLSNNQFVSLWDKMENNSSEVLTKLSFNYKNIPDAVDGILNHVNAYPCDNTQNFNNESNNHKLLLSGTYLNKDIFLCIAIIVYTVEHGCIAKITCRSKDQDISKNIISCFQDQ